MIYILYGKDKGVINLAEKQRIIIEAVLEGKPEAGMIQVMESLFRN